MNLINRRSLEAVERERERAYLYKTCLLREVKKINRNIENKEVNVYMYRVRNCLYDTC